MPWKSVRKSCPLQAETRPSTLSAVAERLLIFQVRRQDSDSKPNVFNARASLSHQVTMRHQLYGRCKASRGPLLPPLLLGATFAQHYLDLSRDSNDP